MSCLSENKGCLCNLRIPTTTPTITTGPWIDITSIPSVSHWSSNTEKSSIEQRIQSEDRLKTDQEQGWGEWLEKEVAGSPWPPPKLSKTPINKNCLFKTENPQSNSECYINILNDIMLQFKNHFHISYLKRKKSMHKISVSSKFIYCYFWPTGCLESFIKTGCYRDNDVIRKLDFW